MRTIVCATRFKYYEAGDVLATSCKGCGEEASFRHLVKCANMTVPCPSTKLAPIVDFLVDLAKKATAPGSFWEPKEQLRRRRW